MSQHDVNLLPNGNISLFNNGVATNTTQPSRAIEFTQTEGKEPERSYGLSVAKWIQLTMEKLSVMEAFRIWVMDIN